MDGSMPPRTCVKDPGTWLAAAGAGAAAAAAAVGAARLAAGTSPPGAGAARGALPPPPQAPSRSPNTITNLADMPRIIDLLADRSAFAPTPPFYRLASLASARALSVISR
jgi:hypothetical protein